MANGIRQTFHEARNNRPLSEESVVKIDPPGISMQGIVVGVGVGVNFQHILETGRIPSTYMYGSNTMADIVSGVVEGLGGPSKGDQYIDWDSDDAYTRAIEEIRQNVFERIESSPELQELLAKDSWSREDRVAWEKGVSEIVNDEHKEIPGLSNYRNSTDVDDYPDVERRASRLNDLSSDIENETAYIEHDCESMSVLEGVILQQVDNAFLPESSESGDFKVSSNYFYMTGRTNFNPEYNGDGAHAFIVSSATANVIEATASVSPYNENINPEMEFSDLINGDLIINNDGSIYGGYHYSLEELTRVRFDRGEISTDAIYEQLPLPDDITKERYAEAPAEAQLLMELKEVIQNLETLKEEGCVVEDGDIDEIIEARKSEFNDLVEEMVDDALIQGVMNFARTVKRGDGTYVDPETRIEAAYDKVAEMHPDWDEDQINQFVFELEVGAIPGYGVLSSNETYDLRAEKAPEVFAERHPDMDYDEAKRAFNTGEVNNMLGAYNRGEISEEELMQDPRAVMARAYNEVHRELSKIYPIPGSAGAYAQIGKRLDAFEREYDQFTGETESCESLEAVRPDEVSASWLPRL